ncbi:MAG: glutamine synthetase beta-grasp domain-containing protein, partial [Pirellulaceae bacterium]|nr:glutamine synthetase beta-grasp domain-containing protein [Pirellulaceae bacterium]
MANSPQEVLVECRQHDVKAVALHVTDSLGKWHQLTIPVTRLTEESFEDGFAWTLPRLADRRGQVSDVLLMPEPSTAFIQPQSDMPQLSLLCTMHDPLTREELPEDPRTIALKAEKFARENGVADQV